MAQDLLILYAAKVGCSIEELAKELEEHVRSACPSATCIFRVKKPDTLRKKMELKHVDDIASIDDIYGFRFLVDSVGEAYAALAAVSAAYNGHLDHDYVAHPKVRSDRPGKAMRMIQYVAARNGVTFEVQITTREWNEANEQLHAEYHMRRYGNGGA